MSDTNGKTYAVYDMDGNVLYIIRESGNGYDIIKAPADDTQ